MTKDFKYPEEISQAEVLKNLERLQAKLRRREGKIRTRNGDGNDGKVKNQPPDLTAGEF